MHTAALTSTNIRLDNHISSSHQQSNQHMLDLISSAQSNLHDFLNERCNADTWHAARKLATKENKKEYTNFEIQKWSRLLNVKNPKDLWENINWKGEIDDSYQFDKATPSSKDLATHFSTKSDPDIDDLNESNLAKDTFIEILDHPITLKELEDSSQLLKDKSSCDGWCPPMITRIKTLYPTFLIIFNAILLNGIFPTKWTRNVVAAIWKNKGTRNFSQYYRPITLVHLLYKWLDFILLNRFKLWFTPADEQTAYQKNKSCADYILIRLLINHSLKTKEKLFVCAIDFDGAFDRVSSSILLKKLSLYGAGSIFIYCLASMYKVTESIIIQPDNYFIYNLQSGIKQGLPLSPFLFIFYINDIFDFMYSLYDNMIESLLDIINILIHADDATILASSRSSLISKIENMTTYCNENKIKLQLSKCSFIVVNGAEEDKEPIPVYNENMMSKSELLILGSFISDTGLINDLTLHYRHRFKNCIKFYNFIRTN